MEIEIKPFARLSAHDRDQLAVIYACAFTPDENEYAWSETDWHVLVREGERKHSSTPRNL